MGQLKKILKETREMMAEESQSVDLEQVIALVTTMQNNVVPEHIQDYENQRWDSYIDDQYTLGSDEVWDWMHDLDMITDEEYYSDTPDHDGWDGHDREAYVDDILQTKVEETLVLLNQLAQSKPSINLDSLAEYVDQHTNWIMGNLIQSALNK